MGVSPRLDEADSLRRHVTEEDYVQLEREWTRLGLDASELDRLALWVVPLIMFHRRAAARNYGTGLDEQMWRATHPARRECLDASCATFSFQAVSEADQLFMLRTALDDALSLRRMDYVVGATLMQPAEGLERLRAHNAELAADMPSMYRHVIDARDRAWYPVLRDRTMTAEPSTVVVGAAHLPGLVDRFAADGIVAEPLIC